MNIISYTSQKTFIFLSRESDFLVATVVLNNKVVAVRQITEEQKNEILNNREVLASQNVFVVEQTLEATALLKGVSTTALLVDDPSVPSPYFLNLAGLELFLTTQKTRGPNKLN